MSNPFSLTAENRLEMAIGKTFSTCEPILDNDGICKIIQIERRQADPPGRGCTEEWIISILRPDGQRQGFICPIDVEGWSEERCALALFRYVTWLDKKRRGLPTSPEKVVG